MAELGYDRQNGVWGTAPVPVAGRRYLPYINWAGEPEAKGWMRVARVGL